MLRLRKMERIVEPDYAMDRHKTMTPENIAPDRNEAPWTGSRGWTRLFTRYSRVL